jgi:serine phosphatase RsbU (regulator of sigma subunit)
MDELYVTHECAINPGDKIVLFTDGIIEARNADEKEFGMDRLIASIRTAISSAVMTL